MALTQISTAGVKDDAVTAGKIPADAIGSSEIAANAVGSSELANDAVDTDAIQDNAVTSAKIAANAVGSSEIQDGNIITAKLASNSVTSAQIAADSIVTAAIQDEAVTLAKLEHGTSSNDGKFLRANDGADPTFETVSGTTINNNADNRIITGSGTANTLNAESDFTYNDSTGNCGLGVAPATGSRLRINQASATDYNASTAANNPAIIIGASSGGGADNKCVGFSINGPNPNAEFNAAMVGNGANEGDFFVSMRSGGSRSDRFRMTHDKQIFLISNSAQHAKLLNDGNVFELRTEANSGNSGMLIFRDGNNDFCGQITSNGASNTTSYNTSSDYRLKTNLALITDGITRVKNLKSYQFEWKSDLGTKVDGFLAHEAQTVVPEAVTGVKDEMQSILYKEGDEIPEGKKVGDVKEVSTTEIKPQTIDQSKFVPLLTAALQEAITKIETLETKVAALEAA